TTHCSPEATRSAASARPHSPITNHRGEHMTTATPTRPATPPRSVDPAPWEPSRWRRFIPTPKFLTLGVVTLVIAYLAIVPLYYLFWGTFFDASGFTFSGFARAYGNDQTAGLIWNSLLFAVGAAAVSLVFGTGLAYLNV